MSEIVGDSIVVAKEVVTSLSSKHPACKRMQSMRFLLGLTRQQASKMFDISPTTIQKVESLNLRRSKKAAHYYEDMRRMLSDLAIPEYKELNGTQPLYVYSEAMDLEIRAILAGQAIINLRELSKELEGKDKEIMDKAINILVKLKD